MSETATKAEPMYPQYRVLARWTQDDGQRGERRDNSVVLNRMYREDPGAEEVERWAREEWWPAYIETKRPAEDRTLCERNPSEPEIEVTYDGEESWQISWFEHWTFDVGQTDREALDSFQRFVFRYADMQDYHPAERPEGYRCLMGAEDRWRWSGAGSDGEPGTRSDPPCRCEHCREQGVIRIGH